MAKASRTIEGILKAGGPCLSNRLCEVLQNDGLTPAAARQRVSRVGGAVQRLHGLPFPRGAKFMFLESQRGTRRYWEALIRDINTSSPAYAAAIAALLSRGGVVPLRHFPIVSGSPLRQSGQLSASAVLQRLKAADIINEIEVDGIGTCLSLIDNFILRPGEDAALRARLLTETILLSAVKEWARKLGAASYDRITTRDDEGDVPRVATFAWDLAGPSYLRPMVRRDQTGKPKPGFLVCDAVLGEVLGDAAVAAFVRKCTLLAAMKRLAPILPVLIAEGYSREAFRLGRSHGIMMATPDLLFGRDVAEALAKLLHTLSKAAAMAVQRPQVIDELFKSLGQIEGAAGNMRGALFEMLVGHCVVKIDDGSIDIGKKVRDRTTGQWAEIDVFRVKENREVWSYECKGHQPTQVVTLDAVERWLTERVPRIHRAISQEERFRSSDFHYEYWTCGTFAPDALQRLKEAQDRTARYAIGWKDGPAVRKYVAKVRPKSVVQMLDDHFLNHPIARIEARYDAPPDTVDLAVEVERGDFVPVPSRRKPARAA
jgi:hypothetical protein